MRFVKKRACLLLIVLVSATYLPHAGAAEANKTSAKQRLVFGFLPILSTEKLVARFGPIADYLGKKLGRPVRFETASGYAEFARRTNGERRYDILFTAPHFYYTAQRQAGYRVIVRVDAAKLAAVIVATKASGIKSVAGLKAHKIAIPDRLSLGALLIRDHLAQAGLQAGRDVELIETPSHNAALLSATKGVTDAAGLMVPPYRRTSEQVRNRLQILATTRGTPHMPISVADRLSAADKTKIQQILIGMRHDTEGKRLLKQMSWPGFVATTPTEYDQMEWAAELIRR